VYKKIIIIRKPTTTIATTQKTAQNRTAKADAGVGVGLELRGSTLLTTFLFRIAFRVYRARDEAYSIDRSINKRRRQ
jgi:hypothetical protein